MSLVVLGIKVGDPDSLRRWVAEGRLPTLASLVERGCHGRLADPARVCEHGTATTLFSGWPVDRHGYYYFRHLVPGSYRLAPFNAETVEARPFWARPELFSGEATIVDAPETRPWPGVRGHQLMNWGDRQEDLHIGERGSLPRELIEDVHRRFGSPADLLGDTANGTLQEDRRALDRFLASARMKGDVARHVLSLGRPDLAVVFFEETHSATHRYWRYRPESRDGGSEDERLRDGILAVHQEVDRELGRVLEQIGGDPDVVFVSLFGMQDQYPTEELNTGLCFALGYQARRTGNGGGLRPLDLARRILPEPLRAAISRRLPGGRQEALLADLFASGTDWTRTTAFSLPSLYTGFVRVNLRGREPAGIVEPRDYEEVLRRLESDLGQLVDAETGEPVIESVVRAADVFGGGPPEKLPDLFVEWRPGTELLERIRHPRAELSQRRPAFCPGSEETSIGFFAAAGPSVGARGSIADVAPIDFAPTLLALLGIDPPEDMPGRRRSDILGR